MKHHLILNIVIVGASYTVTRISASLLMLIFLQLNIGKLKFASSSITINNNRPNAMHYNRRLFDSIVDSLCSSALESLLNYVSIVPGSNQNINANHKVFVFPKNTNFNLLILIISEMLACFSIKFSSFKILCFSIGH